MLRLIATSVTTVALVASFTAPIGQLVNFGSHPRLEWERIILSHS